MLDYSLLKFQNIQELGMQIHVVQSLIGGTNQVSKIVPLVSNRAQHKIIK